MCQQSLHQEGQIAFFESCSLDTLHNDLHTKLTGIQWQFSTPDALPTACTGSITVDNIHFY